MSLPLTYSSLIFVSSSSEKLRDYKRFLGIEDLKWENEPKFSELILNDLSLLVENKIRDIQRHFRDTPFFVDHTGLMIESLNGFPGGLTGAILNEFKFEHSTICRMIEGPNRAAKAVTVLGYCDPSGNITLFHGVVTGSIPLEPRGLENFGWDDIFVPNGSTRTYAEMKHAEKSEVSMRKVAAMSFSKYLALQFELK